MTNGFGSILRALDRLGSKSDSILIARQVALSLLNTPYLWGGSNPMEGFDCSGLVVEILKSVGILPERGDWTAKGLWYKFKHRQIKENQVKEGCLVFWKNTEQKINHVEYALTPKLSIGARGGSIILELTDAIKKDSYVKIRPWNNREGRILHGCANPFKNI